MYNSRPLSLWRPFHSLPILSAVLCILGLSWLPQAAAQSAADFYVSSLPGAPEPLLKMHAGHIEITPEHHGNIFFWHFANRHIGAKPRTVIWLNGGPGCSSMDGAMMEIGPYRVNPDGTLRMNNASWDQFANVLFIDNPVGTGFSFVDGDALVHELDEMADQLITFLEKWFDIFPQYASDELYLAGESFAGQHIPYIASHILTRNRNANMNKAKRITSWNLQGLLIGNGWISGADQYSSYIPFGYETGILKKGSKADENAQRQWDRCQKELNDGGDKKVDIGVCENIMLGMMRDLRDSEGQCFNVYDVRLKDNYPSCGMSWPPDLTQVTPYLRREDVTKALHVSADKKSGWRECDDQVNHAFNALHSKPSKSLLPDLLEQMPIFLFSGDKDLICNHIGTENIIDNLRWNGDKGMTTNGVLAPKREWTFNGEPAGQWQEARNLTYIRFYDSSHMVPFDVPDRAADMLARFIGVDYSKLGQPPGDSYIEGSDKNVVGNPSNDSPQRPSQPSPPKASEPASAEEKERLQAATWAAYQRSGEAALAVVAVAAVAWGIFIWRSRRRRRVGYKGVSTDEPYDDGDDRRRRDLEAAREFDEAELDDLTPPDKDRYTLEDDEEDVREAGRANGHVT